VTPEQISRLKTPDECRQLIAHAARMGRPDIEQLAFRRLCELRAEPGDGPLAREFYEGLVAYEELLTLKNGRTTRATRTRQKLRRAPLLQCMADLVTGPASMGFDMLREHGLLKMSAEYLVSENPEHFSRDAVLAARARLREHSGIDVPEDPLELAGKANGEDDSSATRQRDTSPNQTPASGKRIPHADIIRQYVLDTYITPARLSGEASVVVRAGDVLRDMGVRNVGATICNAMGGRKFLELANVQILSREGPPVGSNVYFCFSLLPGRDASAGPSTPRILNHHSPAAEDPASNPSSWGDALILVSCVKSKQDQSAPARDMYVSNWFTQASRVAQARGKSWRILSAQHRLLHPDDVINPYDLALKDLPIAARRDWGAKVFSAVLPIARLHGRVIFLAGAAYREFLLQPLRDAGVTVEVPMQHLRQGQQMSWLASI